MGNKIKEDKYRFFYPIEFKKMFEHLNKNGQFTADLMVHTGCRWMEAEGFVNNPVFDNERKTITLLKTKVRAKLNERIPRSRIQPLNYKFFYQLKKDVQSKKFRVLSTNAFNIQLREACKKAGVPKPEQISSHNLRKTFATWGLSLGVDVNRLAKHLGHTPQELFDDYTSNLYLNERDIRIIKEILGDIFDKINAKPLG